MGLASWFISCIGKANCSQRTAPSSFRIDATKGGWVTRNEGGESRFSPLRSPIAQG